MTRHTGSQSPPHQVNIGVAACQSDIETVGLQGQRFVGEKATVRLLCISFNPIDIFKVQESGSQTLGKIVSELQCENICL